MSPQTELTWIICENGWVNLFVICMLFAAFDTNFYLIEQYTLFGWLQTNLNIRTIQCSGNWQLRMSNGTVVVLLQYKHGGTTM